MRENYYIETLQKTFPFLYLLAPKNKILIFLFPFSIFLLTLSGCPTEPPIENIPPGRRDYVWTVDTLTAPSAIFYLWSIWGSDTNNIWIAGQGDTPYNLWHYDGKEWKPYDRTTYGSFGAVFGFSNSDMWLAGVSIIYQYNGNDWQKINNTNYPNTYLTGFNDIWGANPKDIYAVGGVSEDSQGKNYFGVIMHFNGSEWQFLNLPKIRVGFGLIRQGYKESSVYFLSGTRFESFGDTNKIFIYDGKGLKQIWSGTEVATVNEMNGKMYLAIGQKIYKYRNNQLEVWKDFTGTNYGGRLWGRSEKDFFGVASDGLAHYNGTDLKTIYPTNLFINDVFVMEKDVFMLCENRIIIHGKLKNK